MKTKNIRGQAVLIVLLSLSVVLIIVLYIMSRSITDISLSSKEEDSMRAFSAAEAGIERALVIGSDTGSQLIGDASFNADVSEFGQASNVVVYPISLKSGEIATFWFNKSGDPNVFNGNQMKICWGDDNTTDNPALEVTVFYRVGPEYRLFRKMLDPLAGRTQNNVSPGINCSIDNQPFEYNDIVDLTGLPNLQFATAKILYNTTTAHKLGIDVSSTASLLPSQGIKVLSDGSFASANRRVEVFQLHPVVPPIFANAIYSASGIVK